LRKADVEGRAGCSESFFLVDEVKIHRQKGNIMVLKDAFLGAWMEYSGRRWPEAGTLSTCPISSSHYISLCFISMFSGTGFWVRWLQSWVWPRMAIPGVDNPTNGDDRGWDSVNRG